MGIFSLPDQVIWELMDQDGFVDEYPSFTVASRPVTCNKCGCKNLKWKQVDGYWRLSYNDNWPSNLINKVHGCKK